MKKGLLFLAFSFITGLSFGTKVTITNSGFTFSPDTATITLGDSVNFSIASIHQIVEVSQTTWNANGNSALSGGFSTGAGGGLVLPAKLTIGTHWYVCLPHAGGAMKGVIIVKSATGILENSTRSKFAIFPNPTSGLVSIVSDINRQVKLVVFNFIGERIYETILSNERSTFDFGDLINGVYFLSLSSKEGTEVKKIIISR